MLICHPSHLQPFHPITQHKNPLHVFKKYTEITAHRESATFAAISITFSCLEIILAGSQPTILKQFLEIEKVHFSLPCPVKSQ